jgi:hypothetical protein
MTTKPQPIGRYFAFFLRLLCAAGVATCSSRFFWNFRVCTAVEQLALQYIRFRQDLNFLPHSTHFCERRGNRSCHDSLIFVIISPIIHYGGAVEKPAQKPGFCGVLAHQPKSLKSPIESAA